MTDEAPIVRSPEEWDAFFYGMAQKVAELSKDPDRRVGAVLVTTDRRQMSIGYNGFPPELPDLPSALADKAFKLRHMRHAEHNCLLQAPFSPSGCTLYVTRFPCLPCAERVAAAGVARVVAPQFSAGSKWYESWNQALRRMTVEGIEVVRVFPGMRALVQDDGLRR